uniref:Major capsid protein N-terminal domain-containing protein n=1 Tax=viral metagenome TaxID=1070528 RepID=A0A6C0H7S5_9ZZZZ
MDGYDLMVGNDAQMINTSGSGNNTTPAYTLYVPLQFWFCRNPGLALPLIALQYHEVKFNITFRPVSQCYVGTPSAAPSMSNASLYIDYIYLDTDERRQFAQVQHEYLIEQLQFTGAESYSSAAVKSKLALNHPCKELVWVVQPDANASANAWSDYSYNNGSHTIVDAKLQLNGQDRFSTRKAGYFALVQPYQHHTRIPEQVGIYVYSFALNPEQHQPSGTVNMSRIDNATLLLNLNSAIFGSDTAKLRVYAVNYNVLRIMAGMGKNHAQNSETYVLLVNLYIRFATLSNCGKLLIANTTSNNRKRLFHSNNVLDWTIRSQDPKDDLQSMDKVQRLNVSGGNVISLRYSLVPDSYEIHRKMGYKRVLHTAIKKMYKYPDYFSKKSYLFKIIMIFHLSAMNLNKLNTFLFYDCK